MTKLAPMLGELLKRDRERASLSIGQAAWRLGLTPAAYRRLEEGKAWPDWETYDRIERLFGWPRAFTSSR
jgi:transcriptional regulator with XRE-family HTH domain